MAANYMNNGRDWRGIGDWDDIPDPETLDRRNARRRQLAAAARARERERKNAQRIAEGKKPIDRAFWTEFRIARLKKMWAEGMSGSQIALALGAASASAVYGKADRLQLPVHLPADHVMVKHQRRVAYGTPSRPQVGRAKPVTSAAEGQRVKAS